MITIIIKITKPAADPSEMGSTCVSAKDNTAEAVVLILTAVEVEVPVEVEVEVDVDVEVEVVMAIPVRVAPVVLAMVSTSSVESVVKVEGLVVKVAGSLLSVDVVDCEAVTTLVLVVEVGPDEGTTCI